MASITSEEGKKCLSVALWVHSFQGNEGTGCVSGKESLCQKLEVVPKKGLKLTVVLKKSESPTGIEPMTYRTNTLTTELRDTRGDCRPYTRFMYDMIPA